MGSLLTFLCQSFKLAILSFLCQWWWGLCWRERLNLQGTSSSTTASDSKSIAEWAAWKPCRPERPRSTDISGTLWSRITKNPDESTQPLARPFPRSLAPLTRALAPPCSLCSHTPLRSFVRSHAHFAHSLARGKVNDWMAIFSVFFFYFGP